MDLEEEPDSVSKGRGENLSRGAIPGTSIEHMKMLTVWWTLNTLIQEIEGAYKNFKRFFFFKEI